MKHIVLLPLIFLLGIHILPAQEFDITVTGTDSGTKAYTARNSVILGPDYTYTPGGGTLTVEISNPVVTGDISYNYTIVDPETRSLNTSYLVGATNGAFSVNALGGATYTIPIDVPPGVGGLQPGLSVTYNSLGGPGVAGYGWNISGISAITRSPQTYYHDGAATGIELTAADRFSLDGQRLVCTSGTYGGNASQYRTENDIFTRVTCTTGSYGPSQFFAEAKSGLDYQYGYDADADQIVSGHNETVNWYVNKITDVYGNEINYEYLKDNGSVYLAEITYGPNTITFYYKERSDKTSGYLKGSKIEQNLVLERIEVKYNSTLVKKYEFLYNYPSSNYTQYSVLNEVVEYGIGGNRLNSTAFSYQTPDAVSFTQTTENTTHDYVTYKSELIAGDYNGDGKSDFLCLPNEEASWTGMQVHYGDGNDNFTYAFSETTSIDINTLDDIRALDLNGDGNDDVIYETVSSGWSTFKYMLFDGSSFSSPVTIQSQTRTSDTGYSGKTRRRTYRQENDNELSGADYNGDGINDIFLNASNGDWRILSFANSSGQLGSSLITKAYGTMSTMAEQVLSADFNGDGKADIWSFQDDGVKIYTFTGTTLSEIYSSTWPSKNHFFTLGDFNADGKVDVFLYGAGASGGTEYDWSEWQVQLSTGTGFIKKEIPKKKNNLKDDYVRLGDFNGDGATDLMVSSADQSWTGTYFYITKNEATDFYTNSLPYYPVASHNYYVADYNSDGRTDFMCTDGEETWWNGYQMYRSGTKNKMLMEKVANGLNQLTEISYKTLSQYNAPYTKGSGASFPVFDFQGALSVVSSILTDNGRGSQNTVNYTYEGAKIHRQGKGFLCYAKQTATDATSSMVTESNYDYHTTYYFPKLTSTVNKYSSTTLSAVSNTWSYISTAGSAIMPYVSSSTQTNSLTGHSVTQTASYDTYGNPTQIAKSFNNGVTETTTNGYDNNTTNWWLGRLESSSISYAKSGETTITRSSSYSYYSDGILKPDWAIFNSGTSVSYSQNNDYDSHGNLTQTWEYSADGGARQTNYTYDTNGIRVSTMTDPLRHVTTKNYDTYGRLLSEVDYLNNTTSFTYDNLGRVATLTQPDGLVTTTTYNWGLSGGPSYSCYYIQQSGNEGSESRTWYDELGRNIRSDAKGFDGSYSYTVTDYNTLGQVYRVSEPSASASPSQWNTNTYDSYGRITDIERPTGRNTHFDYESNGSRITETTAGKTSYRETDSQGLLTLASDNGGSITYTYYPDGKVKTITAPGSVVTSMQYDIAGNQTQLVDPSAGTTSYTWNGFGQLKTQNNARSQTTTLTYLTDGRLYTKATTEGTATYTYNDNEQLTGISSPNSVNRGFTYDAKGRIYTITETIDGNNYLTTFGYDTNNGHLTSRTHPSGVMETMNYNSYGYLASVSAGGVTRYTVTGMNPRQQITAATYGSSLNASFGYDAYGYPDYTTVGSIMSYDYDFEEDDAWLNSRANNNHSGCNESFEYDNLERLDRVYRGGTTLLDMAYSTNGNITTKSDVGSVQFGYNNSSKPYALTDIEAVNGLISDTLQTIAYTSFEQPSSITENPYQATFTYNSDDQRAKMTATQGGNTILTRWYAGSRYMKETTGSVTKEFTYLGGDAYTAPVVAVTQGGTTTYYYLLRDYLGTVTHLVNTANTVVAEYSYDAWGRRRVDDDWDNYNVSSEPDLFAGRGFTGHEYLPWFDLYNMNGRLYDPIVGRFLSADNYVQMSDFTQNYNRYSYCLNNPLVYVDEDGEFPFLVIAAAAIIGGSINVATHWKDIKATGGGWDSFWKGAGYFGVGATAGAGAAALPVLFPVLGTGAIAGASSGFLGGFIMGAGNTGLGGGSFSDALMGGLKMGGMGALTGGVIGGGSALLRGKNFWTGHEIGIGRSAFAIDNSAKFVPERAVAPRLDAGMPNSELNIPNARTELSPMPEGSTIIGETMSRVEAAAANNPGSVILNDMPVFSGTQEQITSKMMQYNRQWILNQMRNGKPIIDIGLDLNRANPSIFYQMEQNMIKNYQILHPGSLKIIKP